LWYRAFPRYRQPAATFPSTPTEGDRALIADVVRDDLRDFAAPTGLDMSGWPTMREAPAASIPVEQ
jgi:hypothetical protein